MIAHIAKINNKIIANAAKGTNLFIFSFWFLSANSLSKSAFIAVLVAGIKVVIRSAICANNLAEIMLLLAVSIFWHSSSLSAVVAESIMICVLALLSKANK